MREVKTCLIEFKDDKSQSEVDIALSHDVLDDDEDIFYYCKSITELESLKIDNDNADFIVKKIY